MEKTDTDMGHFNRFKERTVAVADKPRALSGFEKLFNGPTDSAERMLPAVRINLPKAATARFKLGDGRSVTHGEQDIRVPPGVREISGAALRALLDICKGFILFIRNNDKWRRLNDKERIQLDGGEMFKSENSSPPKPKARVTPPKTTVRAIPRSTRD